MHSGRITPQARLGLTTPYAARATLMTYQLTIAEKPAYLHATVTGRNTRENVARYLGEVIRECATRGCPRVLIEERFEGPRLGALDVLQIVVEQGRTAAGKLQAVAYVDVYAEGDSMRFAETVAVNRGLPVAAFPTVAEAEKWLLNADRRDSQPPAAADADTPRC
jgi:hypothetical protein